LRLRKEKKKKKMTDWTLERVATDKEKVNAQKVEQMIDEAGYSGTYAGGSRSKGNGFWLRKEHLNFGYKSCRAIRSYLKAIS